MYTVPFCGMKEKANDEMTVSPTKRLSDIFKNLFKPSNCFTVHSPEKMEEVQFNLRNSQLGVGHVSSSQLA